MLDLSVVIVACNEERIIGKTLAAVAPIASEIILVDSGSTDRTLEISKQYGAICHYQQWLGYSAQKNHALSLASKSWILSLDADEVVTDALVKEITTLLSQSESVPKLALCNGYRIPRLLYIGSDALKHGGFYPDAQLRLFKNGQGKFVERKVHESVQVEGKIGQLNSMLLHYGYIDFQDYASTLDRYAKLAAEENASKYLDRSGHPSSSYWQTSILNETLHPLWTFCFRYFMRAGFLDGVNGLKANLIYQDYVRKKITYLRQLESAANKK